MEVNKTNFKECLTQVTEAINSSDFIAIDAEFTGIGMPRQNIHAFDTPETRYTKLRQGNMNFLMLQFGLSAFKYDEDTEGYLSRTFNFYIFPCQYNRHAPDIRFMCQASSIDFLISQGFDFNKTFCNGISYLSHHDEKRLLEQLQQKHSDRQMSTSTTDSPDVTAKKTPMAIPDEHKAFIENIIHKVEQLCNSNTDNLELAPCNGFLRKLIYETISTKFASSVLMDTKVDVNSNQRYIKVSKVKDEADLRRIEQEKCNEDLVALDDAVGFSKIIKLISKSEKLVIGHNMFLDVLHTINQFCFPLPSNFEEFKDLSKCIFPRLLDTKHMASSEAFKDHISHTTLGDLQKTLEKSPFKKPVVATPEGFPGYSTSAERLHEAGYDAYITGLCFLSMSDYLASKMPDKSSSAAVLATGSHIYPYLNKLHLMKVYDIPYINLDGPDVNSQRHHIFHVTFAKEWKPSDLNQLFSPFGNIQIVWLNESSALVGLFKKDQSAHVSKQLAFTPKDGSYKIITYQEYMSQNQANGAVTNQPTKRKLPVSDLENPTRRKSSRSSESMTSVAIATIVEEEEEEGSKMDEECSANIDCAMVISPDEDIGEPILKKGKSPATSVKITANKLFDESQPW